MVPRLTHRLVATDLDGTLLHTDGTVSARSRTALTALEDLGVAVVFVTGRPIRWMLELEDHVGPHGLAICSNGGIVYDVPAGVVRRARTIPVDVGIRVGAALRRAAPGTAFAVERTTGFAKEPGFKERYELPAGTEVGPLEELLDDRAVKLLARHEEWGTEELWRLTEDAVGHLVTPTWSSLGAPVEIGAGGVTKATTLALICEELGIAPEEVLAFGDMPNDIEMLAWAGTSYAMANAHPTVLGGVERTAPANDDDGVAVVLEELFGL